MVTTPEPRSMVHISGATASVHLLIMLLSQNADHTSPSLLIGKIWKARSVRSSRIETKKEAAFSGPHFPKKLTASPNFNQERRCFSTGTTSNCLRQGNARLSRRSALKVQQSSLLNAVHEKMAKWGPKVRIRILSKKITE